MTRAIWLFIHLMAVIFWAGGMMFVQFALRPAVQLLPPPDRLRIMEAALRRYFMGVGLCIALVFVSGAALTHALLAGHPWSQTPVHVQAMALIAVLMLVLYSHTMAAPFSRMRRAITASD